jgi:signal transduction histidine kinase
VRRRLLVTYVTLLIAVLGGLTVPLALTIASRDAQTMFIDRLNDTARFAALAEPAMRQGRWTVLGAELRQYDALFDISAAVVGRDGNPKLASRAQVDLDDEKVRERIEAALSGEHSRAGEVSWPWRDDPLVVAEPIGHGGEVIGAALTISPTAALRASIWRSWVVMGAASALVILIGVVAAVPLTRWTLRPVHDLDDAAHALTEGRFRERVVVASGPPELRRLTDSFNAMAERIATLVERQRSFVSYASHQLRTPLATLRLCADNLAPAVDASGRADYTLMVDEIDRMAGLCDALLTYARAEATADDVADVDAADVADARVAAWLAVGERAGVHLVRDGVTGVRVRTAARALDQALDALISNAVKFAGPGATVEVRVTRDNGTSDGPNGRWVSIHVIDDGPGMPPEDLARATEAFWRRPADQNVDGSGLGVTIADALVTASGGRLELKPAQPHGVHARIRLIAAEEPA